MQLGVGFEPRALLEDYLNDPVCDNYSALHRARRRRRTCPGASRELAQALRPPAHGRSPARAPRRCSARRAAALPAGLGRATDVVVERADDALHLRRRRQHVHRLGRRHRHDWRSATRRRRSSMRRPRRRGSSCTPARWSPPTSRMCGWPRLLNEITPGTFAKKTILANSGAESVENAVKLARKFTGRPAVICFEGGYHGRTLLTLSLTSKYGLFKSGFGPFAPEIVRLPIPHAVPHAGRDDRGPVRRLRHPPARTGVRRAGRSVGRGGGDHRAGAGRSRLHPGAAALPAAASASCAPQHGIVMIADEVQCGMGRTGRLFAVEHYGLVPDLIVTAKSLGGGMPIGAVTGRADIMDAAHPGGVGGTYGGNPVACAAAIEAVNIIRQPAFLAHARRLGDVMREVMTGWQRAVADRRRRARPRADDAGRVREGPRHRRRRRRPRTRCRSSARPWRTAWCVMRAGLYSNGVRLLPPLTMPEDMLREGLDALGAAIGTVSERGSPRPPAAGRPMPDLVLYNGHRAHAGAPPVAASTVGRPRRPHRWRSATTRSVLGAAGRRARASISTGRTVVPGFNDAHAHVWKIGHLLTTMLDLRGVDEHRGARGARGSAFATRLPAGAWLLGRGYNEATMAEGRHRRRAPISTARRRTSPVVLTRTCGHIYAVNSRGARARGHHAPTRRRRSAARSTATHDGAPTGVLHETAMGLITRVMPPPTADDYERDDRRGAPPSAVARHHLVVGLRRERRSCSRSIAAMDAGGRLPARDERHAAAPRRRRRRRRFRCPSGTSRTMLRVDTVKFLADGGLSGATAALSVQLPPRRPPGACCASITTSCAALCRESHDAGWRIATHAIGDVAIDQMLDIYETPGPASARAARHRIEHFGLPERRAARAGGAPWRDRRAAVDLHPQPGPQLPRATCPTRSCPARYPIRAMLDAGVRGGAVVRCAGGRGRQPAGRHDGGDHAARPRRPR